MKAEIQAMNRTIAKLEWQWKMLERVPHLLELWGTDDVSAEEWDEVRQWLADLKKMEEETNG
jgi:hypothetical protein